MDELPDFSNSPLFREMERVLRAGSGPVNWELARQVAAAAAAGDTPVTEPSGFDEAVRLAEIQMAEASGLPVPAGIATTSAVGRSDWIAAAIATLTGCVEPAAEALSEGFTGLLPEGAAGLGVFQQQIGGLMLGAQVGTAIGQRAQDALAGWDLVVPPVGSDHLRFVAPNIDALARDGGVDVLGLRQWVALREVALRSIYATPWLRQRFIDATTDFAGSMRPDASALRDKLATLDPSDPDAMQQLLGGGEELLSIELDDEARIKLARVQSLIAVIDGHAEHLRQQVADRLLGGAGVFETAATAPEGDPILGLFGVEFTAAHRRVARDFCDGVALDAGTQALARMWQAPEALPSMVELEEPMLWMARSL